MGPTTDALGALMRFEELAGQIGLTVNRSKTELLCSVEECPAVLYGHCGKNRKTAYPKESTRCLETGKVLASSGKCNPDSEPLDAHSTTGEQWIRCNIF